MNEAGEIQVSIGEVKVGRGSNTLKATLGSCVGIGFIWREKNLCGLAHCLLADGPNEGSTIGARFVSQAVPSLIALMHITPDDVDKIDAVIVGGGNMTAPKGVQDDKLVGAVNASSAAKLLEKHRFRVVHKDVLGDAGRQLTINCVDGTFSVKKIPRLI